MFTELPQAMLVDPVMFRAVPNASGGAGRDPFPGPEEAPENAPASATNPRTIATATMATMSMCWPVVRDPAGGAPGGRASG